jgi:glycosyltransferase involved in cell wall biosynthesis
MKTQLDNYSKIQVNQTPIRRRVLFVPGVLWGDNGITTHLLTLAKGLMKYGWEVALASDLASSVEGAKEEATRAIQRFESYGVKHFFVPFAKPRLSPKNMASAFNCLLKLDAAIRQFRPDIIHVHSLSVCPYIQVMRFLHNIPFVSTSHLEPSIDRLEIKLGAWANEHFNNTFLGNRVIAVSSELKEAFQHILKVPEENIRLNYYGIENDNFRPPSPEERLKARKMFELAPNSKVICLIGRLDPVKGHDVLVRALSILRSQGIEAIALCAGIGYGIGENTVRAQATEEGVSDLVRLLGYTDTRQVLWASDVIALPSRREALPIVILEAMLCGIVPVRTPASGAFDQIEDGVNGFIVPFDDPEALALRLKQLFENDELRSQMSAAALESAQRKFTVDRMTKNMFAVYEEVIDTTS